MYLISTFYHSFELEMLIKDLEKTGIPKNKILAIPLIKEPPQLNHVSATSTGGNNLLDIPLAIGTATMLLGVIYGYVLAWGPILWGLIGLVGGTLLAMGATYWVMRFKQKRAPEKDSSEVILMVNCPDLHADTIRNIIISYRPLGFSSLDINGS